ncbi:MAG TPA: DUF5615 family PIN-like protein [Verrucomicrobiota bacterium]|nr:hypothetical protein [Verrucomicrobiales bacterium]HRI14791.1 DUF5615 family PIN-like protein [Verrucomicrobiota bacterium]
MSELCLHLDEDAEAHALVRALRDRGVDVTTTSEEGLVEVSDEGQLDWAAAAGRVLLTYNAADFCRLHANRIQTGRHHAGIIVAEQQRLPVGELMRRVLRIRARLSAEVMRDRIEFLNRW